MQQSLLVSLLILCNLDQRRIINITPTLDQDRQLCEQAGGCNFAPTAEEMGVGKGELKNLPDSLLSTPYSCTQVVPPHLRPQFCVWSSRPGHFQGVATIVTAIEPGYSLSEHILDRRMLNNWYSAVGEGFEFAGKIVACPTVREASGLAFEFP